MVVFAITHDFNDFGYCCITLKTMFAEMIRHAGTGSKTLSPRDRASGRQRERTRFASPSKWMLARRIPCVPLGVWMQGLEFHQDWEECGPVWTVCLIRVDIPAIFILSSLNGVCYIIPYRERRGSVIIFASPSFWGGGENELYMPLKVVRSIYK